MSDDAVGLTSMVPLLDGINSQGASSFVNIRVAPWWFGQKVDNWNLIAQEDTTMQKSIGGLFFIALTTVAACTSSKTGGSSCGNPNACGGNPVGTWKTSSECIDAQTSINTSNAGCAATWQVTPTMFGSITINSDLSYNWSIKNELDAVTTFTASCLASSASSSSCSDMGQLLLPEIPDTSPYVVHCALVGQECQCDGGAYYPDSIESGQATTKAGVITFTSSAGNATQVSYCVSDAQLTTSPLVVSADAGELKTSMTGTLTYTKQ